ncbi:MAG: sigma-70 family RNA polymerase sigma factor [Planctomycetota bacterium]
MHPGAEIVSDPRETAPAALETQGFADHFRAAYPVMLSVAQGMVGNRADAEDVVQDATVIGFRKWSEYEEGTSFAAWMAAIVRNVALNARRKRRRRDALPFEEAANEGAITQPSLPADERTGQIRPDQQAFDDRVQKALMQLTPVARACLLLRTVHDFDYDTIGETLEIPKNTALSHVHRARQTMRTYLAEGPSRTGSHPAGGGR